MHPELMEWLLNSDEVRVEVDAAVVEEDERLLDEILNSEEARLAEEKLERLPDEWQQTALRSRAGLRPHARRR